MSVPPLMTYLVRQKPKLLARARKALGRWIAGSRQPQVMAAAGPYKAGEVNRLNKNWQPQNYSGDQAVAEVWGLATARIRDLSRNDPAIIALKRALLDNMISTGIGTVASVMAGQDLVEDFNWESDALYEEYCGAAGLGEIDFEGKLCDPEMQRQVAGELLDTGEALILRCQDDDPARMVPLCYQVLESEQLDDSMDRLPSERANEIRRGIEVDRAGRPVAYYLFDVHPNDPHGSLRNRSVRTPAERVIHFTLPGRPSQSRGIGLYNAIIQSAKDLDNYLGSELTAAIIASLFTLVHKTSKPGAGLGFVGDGTTMDGTDDFGNAKVKLGRGIVCQIPKDDDVSSVAANRPNSQAETFIRLILMLVGMGGGVSRYRLTRDYSGTTYVAARAAQIDDRAGFRPMQGFFGRNWPLKVRRDWTAQAAAYGLFTTVTPTQFLKQQRRWQRVQMMLPGWELLDPEAETDSAIARIAAGISTLEIECAARGLNWRRVIIQRAREIEFARARNVPLNFDRPSQPAQNRPSRDERRDDREGQPARTEEDPDA